LVERRRVQKEWPPKIRTGETLRRGLQALGPQAGRWAGPSRRWHDSLRKKSLNLKRNSNPTVGRGRRDRLGCGGEGSGRSGRYSKWTFRRKKQTPKAGVGILEEGGDLLLHDGGGQWRRSKKGKLTANANVYKEYGDHLAPTRLNYMAVLRAQGYEVIKRTTCKFY